MRQNTPVLTHRVVTIGTALLTLLTAAGLSLLPARSAAAACTPPATNYGTITTTVAIETTGTYRIWSRMMAPDTTNNSFLLEIDGGTCFTIGDSAITANQWQWVDYRSAANATKATVSLSAGQHTLKLIGREPYVKVDRILALAEGSCPSGPTGTGSNCTVTSDTAAPTVATTTPSTNATVSGNVVINATANDVNGISKVDFSVDTVLKTSDTAAPYSYTWDTTQYTNGTHTITVQAYDTAGNVGTSSTTVKVQNGDNQAPTAPPTAQATASAPNKVTVKWAASSDNIGVSRYSVSRDNVVIANNVLGTTYEDTTVAPDTIYVYRITAYDLAGNASAPSTPASITTPQATDNQAPTAPSGMAATVRSSSQINISWSASSDNMAVTGYDVYRIPTGGVASKVATVTTTSYGDTNLKADSRYGYYVVARDKNGNSSPQSATVYATTQAEANPDTPSPDPAASGIIRGRVTGGSRDKVLSNVKITMISGSKRFVTTTNSKGVYRFDNLPAGRYSLHYRLSGYDQADEVLRLAKPQDRVWNMWMEKQGESSNWWSRWW